MKQKTKIIYYITLSVILFILLNIIFYSDYKITNNNYMGEKILISLFFIICSIFGFSLALKPNWFKKIRSYKNTISSLDKDNTINKNYIGHHPKCLEFNTHRIKIRKNYYCAGCTGLAIGSIISIILTIFYILNQDIPRLIIYTFFYSGTIILAFVFIEIILPKRNQYIHVITNIAMVITFFLIVSGLYEKTQDFFIGLLTLLLCFLWLDTRIQLSNWQHIQICKNCEKDCKKYF